RREYLIHRVYGEKAASSDMPLYLPAQFQGEWAMGTYSMTAAALTNIAFIIPETREESVTVEKALIAQTLTHAMREFDLQRWGEDRVDSAGGGTVHIGYLGHLNWMMGAYEYAGGDGTYEPLFQAISSTLARRLKESPALCLATYPNELRYVPDNVVVLAS